MGQDAARRRSLVAALLVCTAALAPVSGFAGFAAGQELQGDPGTPTSTPTPDASPSPSATPSATAAPGGTSHGCPSLALPLALLATVRLSPPSCYDPRLRQHRDRRRPGADDRPRRAAVGAGLAAVYGDQRAARSGSRPLLVQHRGRRPGAARYLAEVLAVDLHLDLAVLRLSARAAGGPLPAGSTGPFVSRAAWPTWPWATP